MWDSSHTHTHHTINQIWASQSPPLKSLTSSLGPTLWGSVSELTRGYWASSDTICNDPRKSDSHICVRTDTLEILFVINVNNMDILRNNVIDIIKLLNKSLN